MDFAMLFLIIVCGFIIAGFALLLIHMVIIEKTVTLYEAIAIIAVNALAFAFLFPFFGMVSLGIQCVLLAIFTIIFLWVRQQKEAKRLLEMQEIDIAQAKKRIKEHPTMAAAYERLGDIYINLKQYDLAVENYELAVKHTEEKLDNVAMKGKLKTAKLAQERDEKRKERSVLLKLGEIFKDLE